MIYFIRDKTTEAVKIGLCRDTARAFARLRNLQIGSANKLELAALLEGDLSAERALHAKHNSHHLHGEWFRWSDAIANDAAASLPLERPAPPPRDRVRASSLRSEDLRNWRSHNRLTQVQAARLMGYSLRQYVTLEGRHGELSSRIDRAFRGAQAVLTEEDQ